MSDAVGPAPVPDELVELLFSEILEPPKGYEYYPVESGSQLLYPVYGSDKWRILLHKKGTPCEPPNFYPLFLEGSFIQKLTRALVSLQKAMNESVSDEIPEPTANAAN